MHMRASLELYGKLCNKEMTFCPCQCGIHSRKRDDIRSSGYAWPGETSCASRACPAANAVPATSTSRRSSTFSCYLMFRFFLLMLIVDEQRRYNHVMALQLPDVYWNSSNPIFRIDNTDHIIDVNKNPAEFDRVNIYCPKVGRTSAVSSRGSITDSESINYNYDRPADSSSRDGYYIIYNVSKEEYESCRVVNPAARRMLVCDNPFSDRLSYVTITFRPFTPQPNGPEFHAGHDYYFISTSTGSDTGMDNKIGGRCSTHNMKLVFKVAGKDTPDNDDASTVEPPPLKTHFRLPGPEQLTAYGRVDDPLPIRDDTTTIPLFFRLRSTQPPSMGGLGTPHRPKIMRFTPAPNRPLSPAARARGSHADKSVISYDNNDLTDAEGNRPNGLDDMSRAADGQDIQRSTTNDYFNLIREEDAAVPGSARQTKARASNRASSSITPASNWIFRLVVSLLPLLAIQRMRR
ncbi:uncharacterized protein LOC129589045 isoform X2 [Paramacrobiotus metropolitanus]|uniref:uncharacterized protein LOC129589045 isoform X2 n=1 Tax=Paramacrobiotus metropolitanus TaxID=2943436 RepID=UPI002445E661|nr:uncharacterized protein LOC129589045 isoform X2 [Paramacrobiotus metropolitanus]